MVQVQGLNFSRFPKVEERHLEQGDCFWSNQWLLPGWWFEIFFIFIPIWGNDPILQILFKWVETTN